MTSLRSYSRMRARTHTHRHIYILEWNVDMPHGWYGLHIRGLTHLPSLQLTHTLFSFPLQIMLGSGKTAPGIPVDTLGPHIKEYRTIQFTCDNPTN
uniref:Uncharacterized protein n=1 Tax=Anguilla anguilla TaxID=7936 RepID=A0A0E9WXU7_ANGAN